jgi:hypothetical protein
MVARSAALEKRLKIHNKTLDTEYRCIVTIHQHKRVQGGKDRRTFRTAGSAVLDAARTRIKAARKDRYHERRDACHKTGIDHPGI